MVPDAEPEAMMKTTRRCYPRVSPIMHTHTCRTSNNASQKMELQKCSPEIAKLCHNYPMFPKSHVY